MLLGFEIFFRGSYPLIRVRGIILEACFYEDIIFILVFAHPVNNRGVVLNLIQPVAVGTRSTVHPFQINPFSFLKIAFTAVCRKPAISIEHCCSYPDKINSSEYFRPCMTVFDEFAYVFSRIEQFILITRRRYGFNTTARKQH